MLNQEQGTPNLPVVIVESIEIFVFSDENEWYLWCIIPRLLQFVGVRRGPTRRIQTPSLLLSVVGLFDVVFVVPMWAHPRQISDSLYCWSPFFRVLTAEGVCGPERQDGEGLDLAPVRHLAPHVGLQPRRANHLRRTHPQVGIVHRNMSSCCTIVFPRESSSITPPAQIGDRCS